MAKYKESDKNKAYSESPTNVVEKKLRLDSQMNHSKGWILKHVL